MGQPVSRHHLRSLVSFKIDWFDALVRCFRASGCFAVRPFLTYVPHIRILVGINVAATSSASSVCAKRAFKLGRFVGLDYPHHRQQNQDT